MLTRLGTVAAIAGLLAGLAACGGSSSSDQVRAAYSHVLSALGSGDYRTFCGLLAASYRAKLVAAEGTAGNSVSSCAKLFAEAVSSGSLTKAQLKATAGQQIRKVTISGHTARITVAQRVGQVTLTGEATAGFESGAWRIASFPTKSRAGNDVVYRVPSPSMMPALHVGQQVLVDPASYRTQRPAVGDIVVFHPPTGADPLSPVCGDPHQGGGHAQACGAPLPHASSQTFIKRVVAGPGDTIQILSGRVIRNGVPEAGFRVVACADNASCTFRTAIKIPRDDYFMLGDNRGASDDSRFWGPVRLEWIVGKVVGSVN